jgi:dinuclear metal center YbgI/SA1388 family protein
LTSLHETIAVFETLWPLALADEWDAPGLVTGNPEASVTKVLLTVDVTSDVIAEANEAQCDLVLAHHPYLLRGVKTLAETTAKGRVVTSAIRQSIAIYATHTNADVVENGVSDVLATQIGLANVKPLVPTQSASIGHGRIGDFKDAISLGDLAVALGRLLPATAGGIKVSGDFGAQVKTVALCGGAGDSFLNVAQQAGADVYITSDLRHHPAQDSRETAPSMALIDISHWAAESLWLEVAAVQLAERLPAVEFVVSQQRTDPWDFVVTQ